MGHRRFLPLNHPLRRKGKHFKGEPETRAKPMFRNGKHVFLMVKDVLVVFEKGRGSQQVSNDKNGHAPMWKKKSILWELPYWEVLEVRNAIDVMHLTENLCMNLLEFLLDEVINPKGEFYSDQRISMARADPKKRRNGDDEDND